MGGVFINLRFAEVDAVNRRLSEAGVDVAMPLEDHPWGDRGFAVVDPAGATVYCYHPIPPAPEFARFFTGALRPDHAASRQDSD